MATEFRGRLTSSLSRDGEGHRTYRVKYLVASDDVADGPKIVLDTNGLPNEGDSYSEDNDQDQWAWCQAEAGVSIAQERQGDPAKYYVVEKTFSTKPPQKQRCQDNPITDPLLEPAKISGSAVKYTEEASQDRFGFPIRNSAWEQIRGPQVEFDRNRGTIKIEQNVGSFDQIVLAFLMMNMLNTAPIWGCIRRQVKLSGLNWDRKFHGQCSVYFTRHLEFDVSESFDKDIVDQGTLALNGRWNVSTGEWTLVPIGNPGQTPNPANPSHFQRYKDRTNQPATVLLNGAGIPAGTTAIVGAPGFAQYYISISDINTNQVLTTTSKWLPIVGPIDPPEWLEDVAYLAGNLVRYRPNNTPQGGLDSFYIALANNTGVTPALVLSSSWRYFGTQQDFSTDFGPTLPGAPIIQSAGIWNTSTNFTTGYYVFNPKSSPNVGNIHVERYSEIDFLLLGVPVDFTVP